VIIAGDFDASPNESPVLASALGTGHWVDLHAMPTGVHGHELQPTCFASSSAVPTRIDLTIGNRIAAAALCRCLAVDGYLSVHWALTAICRLQILVEKGYAVATVFRFDLSKTAIKEFASRQPLMSESRRQELLAEGGSAAMVAWNSEAAFILTEAVGHDPASAQEGKAITMSF
jgi:hypothetical protein